MTLRPLIAALIMVMTGGLALAQPRPGAPSGGNERRFDEPAEQAPGEIQKLFDAYAVVHAQEMLKLPDSQYGQFVARLKALQQTRRRNQQARNRIIRTLVQLTRTDGDEALLREQLKALAEQDARASEEARQAYAALDQVLDVRQQARFRVFEEQIERRKFEFLMRARQNRQARPGRNPS